MDTQNPKLEILPLEPMDMHAPIEVTVAVRMMTKDGKSARIMYEMPPGQVPTRAAILEAISPVTDPEMLKVFPLTEDARPMTKPEFVAHITTRATGAPVPMAGDQHFVPAPPDIPHGVLVHAICGAGFGKGGYATPIEMTERGLAKFTGNQWNEDWSWDAAALGKQPDDVLLSIYKQVTA